MPAATVVSDHELQPHARTAVRRRLRRGTGRGLGPPRARLKSGGRVGRRPVEVDLVRRSAVERLVRSVLVVPFGVEAEFLSERVPAHGNEQSPGALGLHTSDEPFDNRDAAMPANGPEPKPDATAPTPGPEALAPELRPFVADDVLGGLRRLAHGAPGAMVCRRQAMMVFRKRITAWPRCREQRRTAARPWHRAHYSPREVIDHSRHPPAEWPPLGQGSEAPVAWIRCRL